MYRIARALATLAAPGAALHGRGDLGGAARTRRNNRSTWRVSRRWTTLPETPSPTPAWERLTKLREEAAGVLEASPPGKVIGSSLEGAIVLTPNEALEADRAATGTRRRRGSPTSSSSRRRRRRRPPDDGPDGWSLAGLSRPLAPLREGARAPVRPLLEGDARGGGRRPLRPLPAGPRTLAASPLGRRMNDFPRLKESALYRGGVLPRLARGAAPRPVDQGHRHAHVRGPPVARPSSRTSST